MRITRREVFGTVTTGVVAAGSTVRAAGFGCSSAPPALGVVADSFGIRRRAEREGGQEGLNDPLAMLAHCRAIGAAGVQMPIGIRDAAAARAIHDRLDTSGLYLEASIALPQDRGDLDRFDREIRTAAQSGATIARTVMLNGRRYEDFDSASAFLRWGDDARQRLALAEPIVARNRIQLAVENHKDWRVDELLEILGKLGSHHVGVCVDTGNNLSLLEDPTEVVASLAPLALTTHFKDIAVRETGDGFLLAEVPLGEGFLDLARFHQLLSTARPGIHFNLEMLTRNPLRIPCLTPTYWATLARVSGRDAALALGLVRRHGRAHPLPSVDGLTLQQQIALEAANVQKSLEYARNFPERRPS